MRGVRRATARLHSGDRVRDFWFFGGNATAYRSSPENEFRHFNMLNNTMELRDVFTSRAMRSSSRVHKSRATRGLSRVYFLIDVFALSKTMTELQNNDGICFAFASSQWFYFCAPATSVHQ
jgi:hypothetical protein